MPRPPRLGASHLCVMPPWLTCPAPPPPPVPPGDGGRRPRAPVTPGSRRPVIKPRCAPLLFPPRRLGVTPRDAAPRTDDSIIAARLLLPRRPPRQGQAPPGILGADNCCSKSLSEIKIRVDVRRAAHGGELMVVRGGVWPRPASEAGPPCGASSTTRATRRGAASSLPGRLSRWNPSTPPRCCYRRPAAAMM